MVFKGGILGWDFRMRFRMGAKDGILEWDFRMEFRMVFKVPSNPNRSGTPGFSDSAFKPLKQTPASLQTPQGHGAQSWCCSTSDSG